MSEDLRPAELLEKGAAYIEEHGLWQGAYWRSFDEGEQRHLSIDERIQVAIANGEAVCVSGAIAIAAGKFDGGWVDALIALERQVGGRRATAWNDTPGRTAGEVADAMRSAATEVREAAS